MSVTVPEVNFLTKTKFPHGCFCSRVTFTFLVKKKKKRFWICVCVKYQHLFTSCNHLNLSKQISLLLASLFVLLVVVDEYFSVVFTTFFKDSFNNIKLTFLTVVKPLEV